MAYYGYSQYAARPDRSTSSINIMDLASCDTVGRGAAALGGMSVAYKYGPTAGALAQRAIEVGARGAGSSASSPKRRTSVMRRRS